MGCVRLLAVTLLAALGFGAQARPSETCGEGSAAARCLAYAERASPRSGGFSGPSAGAAVAVGQAAATSTLALWAPPVTMNEGLDSGSAGFAATGTDDEASQNGEPPTLGLLLAALCVVAFMAHRRGGG